MTQKYNTHQMPRFKIHKQKNGVSVWDNVNQFYVIDASTIQEDGKFTINKWGAKKKKHFECPIGSISVFEIVDVKQKSVKVMK
jgi:hypothetical protein